MDAAGALSGVSTVSAAALQRALPPQLHLAESIAELSARYRGARPFPHLVIDNLFPDDLLERVRLESQHLQREQWIDVETRNLEKIARMNSALELGEAGNELVALVHSASFLYMLSEITDIWQLLPDPYLQGGGHAVTRRGGFFKVHADRNVAYDTGLRRRLAMIIFLNHDWKPEYHGELELWDAAGARCEVSVKPDFNRTIFFEVAFPNYHGVPQPLACPPERMRQSFLVYYHTVGIGQGDKITPHTSLFAPHFYRERPLLWRRIARQIAPPILARMWRRVWHHDRN